MALDWSAFPGAAGGFQGAVEMCNNNGACRKLAGGACARPTWRRATSSDVTRGRANTLRLAITGQLGPDALTSDGDGSAPAVRVVQGCRRECPTGVDMARMKIEVLAARAQTHGLPLRDRLVAYLPRYGALPRPRPLAQPAQPQPGAAPADRRAFAGISARRALPAWRRDVFAPDAAASGPEGGREVVLFADSFNRSTSAKPRRRVARPAAGGYRVHLARPARADGRCAAGALTCRPGWSARRGASSTGSSSLGPSPAAACRSSGSSRAAS